MSREKKSGASICILLFFLATNFTVLSFFIFFIFFSAERVRVSYVISIRMCVARTFSNYLHSLLLRVVSGKYEVFG